MNAFCIYSVFCQPRVRLFLFSLFVLCSVCSFSHDPHGEGFGHRASSIALLQKFHFWHFPKKKDRSRFYISSLKLFCPSPAIMAEQNHSPDLGDCCARSIVPLSNQSCNRVELEAVKKGGYGSVQQKNPALWRGFSGYRLVYLFECLLHRSLWVVTIRYALSVRRW